MNLISPNNHQQGEPSQIVFILGGPGSGKGTQCERLVKDLNYKHLSVGDLMRAEIQNKTKEGSEVQAYVARGALVPDSLTVQILMKAIKSSYSKKFLIDGFPRSLPQAIELERLFREIDFILNFECPEDVLEKRLLSRGKSSGRIDDQNIETVRERIKTFNTQTYPAIEYYTRLGKVKTICSNVDVDTVYKKTREALLPNIICIYSPPYIGQSHISQSLANHLNYTYININEFFISRNCINENDDKKIDYLISYIRDHYTRNFIIDDFPRNIKQFKKFFEYFVEPLRFIDLNCPKNEIENIYMKDNTYKKKKDKKHALEAYEEYCKYNNEILEYVINKKYYYRVDIHSNYSPKDIIGLLIKKLSPQILVYPKLQWQKYGPCDMKINACCENLFKQRGFMHINLVELINSESQRNTELWKKVESISDEEILLGDKKIFAIVRKAIYYNLCSNQQIVISGVPCQKAFFEAFKTHVCDISYVLANIAEEGNMIPLTNNPICEYHKKGKLIDDDGSLSTIDTFIQNRCKFSWILGPRLSGKSTVGSHLFERYAAMILNFERETTSLNKASIKTDPINEMTPADMIKLIKGKLNTLKKNDLFIIDGFPQQFTINFINLCMTKIRPPDFVISLIIDKETVKERLRDKNNLSRDEISEDEIEKSINEANNAIKIFKDYLISNKQFPQKIYSIDANGTIDDLFNNIDQILCRKMILVRNFTKNTNSIDIDTFMAKFCIKHKIILVNVQELFRAAIDGSNQNNSSLGINGFTIKQNGSSKDDISASLETKIIKRFIQETSFDSKYVIIFDQLSNHTQEILGHEPALNDLYPKSKDELYYLEKYIGPFVGAVDFINTHTKIIQENNQEEPICEENSSIDQDHSHFRTFHSLFNQKLDNNKIKKAYYNITNDNLKNLEEAFESMLHESKESEQNFYALDAYFP